MTIPRLLAGKIIGKEVLIAGEEHLYASKVLRLKQGQQFYLRDRNHEFLVEVSEINQRELKGFVLSEVTMRQDLPLKIVLAFGLCEKDALTDLLFMATELGVQEFYPLITKRVQYKTINKPRLLKVIQEAIRVSGRKTLPLLQQPQSLTDIGENLAPSELCLVFYEESKTLLKRVLEQISPDNIPQKIIVLIGPEGGLDDSEVKYLISRGAKEVSLGEVIYKVRTAVVSALAIINHHFTD